MKIIIPFLFIVLMLSITACKESNVAERGPVRVRITTITDRNDKPDIYSGTVEEELSASLSFQVPGTIEQLPVSVGQHVTAGQLIASVNPANMQNTYNAAAAALSQARDAYAATSA